MNGLSAQEQTLGLFAGLGVVLLVASIVGQVLKRRIAKGRPHDDIDNLNARINAWWVMVLIVAVAFVVGPLGVTLLFFVISFAALREFTRVTDARGTGSRVLAASFFVVLPVQYLFVYLGWYILYSVFIPIAALVVATALHVLRRDTSRVVQRTATIQWGLIICVFCISHVPALLTMRIPGYEGRDLLLVLFLLLIVQFGDVLQYVWGKLLGRAKVAPLVSPSKTWAGLIGGVLSASALGAALSWMTPFTPAESAVLALILVLAGFCGGLVLSAIKRGRGTKDWGRLINGHGGVLDRVDSLVFAAPLLFHVTRLGWNG